MLLDLTEAEADSVVGALRYAQRMNPQAHWPAHDLRNFRVVAKRIRRLPESPPPRRGGEGDVGRKATMLGRYEDQMMDAGRGHLLP